MVAASDAVHTTLYFPSMSKRIGVRAGAALDKVVATAGRAQRISIEGYADYRGDESYNLELSEERADAVAAQLIRRGIAKERIIRAHFGERRADPRGDELWRDRRVDIRILEGDSP